MSVDHTTPGMTLSAVNATLDATAGRSADFGVGIRNGLVLSLFPGADLFGRGFELEGFCVVRGPDILWGQDIRGWKPLRGVFGGIIGGSPCQDFSSLRRCEPSGNGLAMLAEFARVTELAAPRWFILENVVGVPDIKVPGYHVQRLNLAATECGASQRRLRCIQFGQRYPLSKLLGDRYGVETCLWRNPEHHPLVIPRSSAGRGESHAALASEGRRAGRRSWGDFCQLQGLPADFDLPGLSRAAKYQAVGNGVPVQMARVLARAVVTWSVTEDVQRVCVCQCGRPVRSGKTLATAACRKRMERRRRDAAGVTGTGPVTDLLWK